MDSFVFLNSILNFFTKTPLKKLKYLFKWIFLVFILLLIGGVILFKLLIKPNEVVEVFFTKLESGDQSNTFDMLLEGLQKKLFNGNKSDFKKFFKTIKDHRVESLSIQELKDCLNQQKKVKIHLYTDEPLIFNNFNSLIDWVNFRLEGNVSPKIVKCDYEMEINVVKFDDAHEIEGVGKWRITSINCLSVKILYNQNNAKAHTQN